MKFTKLSLVAALAVSSAFAGGDIAPVEPVVETPAVEAVACNSNTTLKSKAQLYYYTDDNTGLFDQDSSNLGAAVTFDVSHKLFDGLTANFTAIGYANLMDEGINSGIGLLMEGNDATGSDAGAIINVANLTATFGDTTLIAGRQLLDTPMLGGFDWLLAPGSFEAYTVVNKSVSNLTLVGSYVAKWRANGTGAHFADLTDSGDNWTIGASYSDAFDASVWYYNVDAANYTQVYADAGMEFSSVKLAGQFVYTDWDAADSSTAFGLKASTTLAGIDLAAAYNNVSDNTVGFIGRDSLYTSSWNTFTSTSEGNAFKIEAGGEFASLTATASYAYYDYDQGTNDGHEIDVILGYGITDCISVDAIYSNTDYGTGDDVNALELIATYKF